MFEASSSPAIPGNTRIGSSLLLISRFSWAIVSAVGCFGLLGWVFNFASFKQIMPGLATMKANTALCFILAGAALAGLHTEHRRQPIRWAGRLCAGAVVMIAVLTLIEYVVGWNPGIDQFLFADTDSVVFPGRMSIVTALSFSLLGLALLLLDYQRAYWLVNMLVVLALLIAWIALIGYIYGVASLYRVLPFSTIAVHTAANLIILSIGTLFARPSYGLAALIASDSAGGLMARRLLPVAVFIPLLLGWLRWEGQLAGLYDTEFGLMIMVVATTVGFVAFIWWNAKSLDRLELGRLRIAEALHNSEERFRAIFEQAAVGIARVGQQGQWLQVNQKLCDIVGYTPTELLQRTFQSMTYHEDLDADLAKMRRTLRGELSTYSMEKRYVHKNGTLVWINLTVSLVRDASGEPQYFIAVVEDIADRKRVEAALRESEERLGGIVGSAMDAIVSIDEARNIVLFNAAAEQMFRCSASATIGQSIDQFVPVHLRDRHVTHVQTFGAIGATSRTMRSLDTLTAVRADGEEFPIEATISKIVVAGQKIYTVIIRDITERKHVEVALLESEERLRAVTETARVGLVIVDREHRYRYANRAYAQIFHLPTFAIVGLRMADVLANVYEDQIRPRLERAFRGENVSYELVIPPAAPGGEQQWYAVAYEPSRYRSETVVVEVVLDISERKRAEAALRQSEERFAKAFRVSPAAMVISRLADGSIIDTNDSYQRLFEYSREGLFGHTGSELNIFVDPGARAEVVRILREHGAIRDYEITVRAKSGEIHEVLISIEVIELDGEACNLVIMFDITDRKRAEQALQTERYWLRILIDSLPDLIFLKDTHSRFMIGNQAIAQFINVSTPEALIGKTDFDFFPPEAAARYYAQEQQVIQSGEPLIIQEKRQTDVVGNYHWLSTTKMALRDAHGQVVGLVGIERVITERKQAEAALRQSEERFAKAFHASPAALTITRISDGCFIDMNESFERLLGYRREELIDHSSSDLNMFTTPDERAELVRRLREHGFVHDYETTLRTQSGEVRNVLFSTEAIDLEGEACIIALLFDITDRKRAEHAIQRYTERLKHLRQIDQAMLANCSLEEIAQAALAHIWQMIPCTRASIVLVDMAAETITLFAVQVNGEPRVPPGLQAPIAIIGEAFDLLKQGQVYQVPDIAALPEPPPALHAAQVERVRAYVYVPIISDTELLGMLCLGSDQPGVFPDESIDIAMELAGQLAIAIDQARLRAQIEHHAVELEQRVAERTAELAAANHELEAFSYSVSHDLRAPLRAIAGFSRILIEEYLPDLPDEARDYLLLVRDNAKRMDHLINELLAFARLGRQALNKQLLAPAELVRQIITELSGEQAEREVEFVIADLPICSADPALLRQVYVNLLANALKFSSKRAAARIEVGAQTTPERPNETVYFVEDNGAGFDMRYAGKLFGVFQRLHRAEDYEGTGVGLAIVQRVIHRHGGRVWAEAAVDRGATFYFTLGDSGNYV